MNLTNAIVFSPGPRAKVYCLKLNINISKLGYCFADTLQFYNFFGNKRRQFLKFSEICLLLRYMLVFCGLYTLMDHSSRPISLRDICQFWYHVLLN